MSGRSKRRRGYGNTNSGSNTGGSRASSARARYSYGGNRGRRPPSRAVSRTSRRPGRVRFVPTEQQLRAAMSSIKTKLPESKTHYFKSILYDVIASDDIRWQKQMYQRSKDFWDDSRAFTTVPDPEHEHQTIELDIPSKKADSVGREGWGRRCVLFHPNTTIKVGTQPNSILGRSGFLKRIQVRGCFRNVGNTDAFRVLIVRWPEGGPRNYQNQTRGMMELCNVLEAAPYELTNLVKARTTEILEDNYFSLHDSLVVMGSYPSSVESEYKDEDGIPLAGQQVKYSAVQDRTISPWNLVQSFLQSEVVSKPYQVLADRVFRGPPFRKEDKAAEGISAQTTLSAHSLITSAYQIYGATKDSMGDGCIIPFSFDLKINKVWRREEQVTNLSTTNGDADLVKEGKGLICMYVIPASMDLDGVYFNGDNAVMQYQTKIHFNDI